ncbi:MAG: uroporphyrinogen decarboxylase [Chromatiales bacterium]|jgi:uroporphyrinogen decarboxylase|nr:uroporphyrinogen decarboxylase [Chromatiales bacterium]
MTVPLKNDRLLRALRRQPVDRTPVWMMRQAGRYLPEYRATRAKAGDFMTLCSTPDLACEVTLQPLERFPLDAAIIFSDILTIPDAMGLGLSFAEGEGPRFAHPIRDAAAIDQLPSPDPETELRYVMDALRVTSRALAGKVPLIGFSGSPWTLMTYMVEGRGGTDFRLAKGLLIDDPHAAHRLLDKLAKSVGTYLNAQIAAGAQALMVFDTWGGILTPHLYREFSLRYMSAVLDSLNRHPDDDDAVPVIFFTKGGGGWLEDIAASGCDGIGLDWTIEMGEARARVGEQVALQGNFDPAILFSSPQAIREEVRRILDSYGRGSGHIFNLGHGIQPQVPPEHAGALIGAVQELSPAYHP